MELVTRIQAVYRGRMARKAYLRKRAATVRIQVRFQCLGLTGCSYQGSKPLW